LAGTIREQHKLVVGVVARGIAGESYRGTRNRRGTAVHGIADCRL